MNRRNFLKTLALGTGIVAAAPLVDLAPTPTKFGSSFSTKPSSVQESPLIWNPTYSFDWAKRFPYTLLTENHPSPVGKYQLLHDRLAQEGLLDDKISFEGLLTRTDFLRVHTPEQLDRLEDLSRSYLRGLQNGENPVNRQILQFAKDSSAGTYHAGVSALILGTSLNLSGGFHHAFPDHEEGFCLLNDVAVAIRKLQAEEDIDTAMVIDGDVHHGNGTAYIFKDDPTVQTFDIYQTDTYPGVKHPTDVTIALASKEGVDDNRYLTELKKELRPALEKYTPDIIFYLAGADPFKDDRLGSFQLTHEGLQKRDNMVITTAHELGIPLAITLAGGYAENIEDVVQAHYNTARLVASR
jgi:acetoin utilization deacetylase AcuC-like enzyme